MDTQREIAELVSTVPTEISLRLESGVVQHIKRAEFYFREARQRNDDEYYTDAIYRANQAFEGILKEAYEILLGKNADKLRPFDIENELEQGNVFNSRVRSVFGNYRQEWRNSATHNHRLFFKQEEAYLAIASVSAFIFVLLTQIAQKIAYNAAKRALSKQPPVTPPAAIDAQGYRRLILSTLERFRNSLHSERQEPANESQVIGALLAYLEQELHDANIRADYTVGDGLLYRVDIGITSPQGHQFVIEVKHKYSKKAAIAASMLMSSYLAKIPNADAIVYFYSNDADKRYASTTIERAGVPIYVVFPEKGQG